MDDHLTFDLLRAVHEGDRDAGEIATNALAHLLDLCPHCRGVFEDWRRETVESEAGVAAPGQDRLRVGSGVEMTDEEPAAPGRFAELLALPQSQRMDHIRLDPQRYRGPVLAHLLLQEIYRCLPSRPREARSLARLARAIVQHEVPSTKVVALYARALAHEGNALRALGEISAADDLMQTARYLLVSQGCDDPLAGAELDNLEGTLRRVQRRLDEARDLLARSAEIYGGAGLFVDQARTLISLGILWRELGRLDTAIDVTNQALDLLDTLVEPRLALCAQHNLAVFYRDTGDFEGARRVLLAAEDLYTRFADSWTRLHKRAIQGAIAQAEGDFETAEVAYREVRDGYVRENRHLDAALIGKDLAAIFAQQRRFAELEDLTLEIVAVFEELQVYPEADAARRLLAEATGADSPRVH